MQLFAARRVDDSLRAEGRARRFAVRLAAAKEKTMRHLTIMAAAALLIAASGSAGAGSLSPAGLSHIDGLSPIQLVQERRQPETLERKVKRAWKNLVGYKFNVSCPIIFPVNHSTCTETGKDREDARAKCQSRNTFCSVRSADAN
jgi:hypothetical protein